MSEVLASLRANRQKVWAEANLIAVKASQENRILTHEEQSTFNRLTDQLDNFDARIQQVAGENRRETETREAFRKLEAQPVGGGPGGLSSGDAEIARAFRSAIRAKNPAPIEFGADLRDSWPDDLPDLVGGSPGRVRIHQGPGVETRDTLKSTATQAMGVSVYDRIVEHMVEVSAVMAAGATVVTTGTGEDLQIPKSTGFVSTALTAEGASITEGDPTLGVVTLKAYKYASFFELSNELANDTPTNLLEYLSRAAVTALGLSATGYGDDLINGAGSTEPRGLLLDAATGVTGPTGTGTTLGTQGTVNQGTDALWNLVGSVAEPYAAAPKAAFLMRNASDITVRKLRDTTGQPVQGLGQRGRILGYPSNLDPFMPAMANAAESIAFGDMSKYFIRIVNGFRFERSNEFHFQQDLVSFRWIVRLDGALVDTNAVKTFVNTT